MIVDTSALLAFFDRSEPAHEAITEVMSANGELLVVSPYVLVEVDYLVMTRHGADAESAVLAELASGAWELACLDAAEFRTAREVVTRYADLRIGLADASNVVLAERYGTRTVATLDRRHFSVLRTSDGSALTIVP